MVSGSPFVAPYSNPFVSQSGWWCPVLWMSPIHLSPLTRNSFVSQSGWWCRALRVSPIHLSPLIAINLSPSLAGGFRLSGCLQFICLPLKQFICLPVWPVVSGPALWMSPIHLSPHKTIYLSPSLAGFVRLSGCLQLICLPL